MLRFARAPDGVVAFDVAAKLPGRGVWTCANERCVADAVARGAFGRGFDAPVLVDAPGLVADAARLLDEEVKGRLGLAHRAGLVASGRTAALDPEAPACALLVVADDLAARSRALVPGASGDEAGGAPDDAGALPGPTMEALGAALGRGPTGIVGVRGQGPLVEGLRRSLERRAWFLGQRALPESVKMATAPTSRKAGGVPCDARDQGI